MVYIKPKKKANIVDVKTVLVKDVAEVFADRVKVKDIEKIKIFEIPQGKNANYLVSALNIIEKIIARYPDESVANVGEKDIVIDYTPKKKQRNKIFEFLKVAIVCLILFAGSATAIMSFHSDAQIPQAFKNYYYLFFNEKSDNPIIIDLPYSIGLAVGMIVFFNHFAGRKMTDDPTPIQVEMAVYDADVVDTMVNILETEKEQDEEGGGD